MRRGVIVVLVVVVGLVALLVANAGGGDDGDACAEVVTEELDPNWVVHLLPGDAETEPEYLTEPPTSGPHFSSPPVEGVQGAPLERPLQVTVLEAGSVLAQYDPNAVSGAERSALEDLAHEPVVVAPNSDLADPVVLTAWLHKQTCGSVDAETIESFAAEYSGNAPGVVDH